jgi:hypothetical protein
MTIKQQEVNNKEEGDRDIERKSNEQICPNCQNKNGKNKFLKIVKEIGKTIITNRALIALIASSLGVGGSEIIRGFNNKAPIEERYMCKPGYVIRLETEEEKDKVNICGCEVKLEEIKKVKKGNKVVDRVDLTCKNKE